MIHQKRNVAAEKYDGTPPPKIDEKEMLFKNTVTDAKILPPNERKTLKRLIRSIETTLYIQVVTKTLHRQFPR